MELSKRCLGLNRKYDFDQNCFELIDTETKAYWLGFLMADGHVRVRRTGNSFCLTSVDLGHLEKYKLFLNHPGDIKPHHDNCYRFEVYSNKVVNDLLNLGIVPNKSFRASVPNIKDVLLKDFIRGVFDGDGTIGYCGDTWRASVVSATKSFIYDLKSIINRFSVGVSDIDQCGSVYKLSFGGSGLAYAFGKFIYDNATIYLDRKYNKYLELCDYINPKTTELVVRKLKPCSMYGCKKSIYAKNLCRYHYDRSRYLRERVGKHEV